MSAHAETTVDAVFDHLGERALYTAPAGGDAIACRIMRDVQDAEIGAGRVVVRGGLFVVRVSEIAAPAKGGQFQLVDDDDAAIGAPFKVLDEPRTPDGDVLRLTRSMTVSQ